MWIDNRRIYKISDGENHWVIARNRNEAISIYAKDCGYGDSSKYIADMKPIVTMCGPMEKISIIDDGGNKTILRAVQWLLEPENPENDVVSRKPRVLCSSIW